MQNFSIKIKLITMVSNEIETIKLIMYSTRLNFYLVMFLSTNQCVLIFSIDILKCPKSVFTKYVCHSRIKEIHNLDAMKLANIYYSKHISDVEFSCIICYKGFMCSLKKLVCYNFCFAIVTISNNRRKTNYNNKTNN